jgi:hypothetical protein
MESEAHKQAVIEIVDRMKGMDLQCEQTSQYDIITCDGKLIIHGDLK